MKAILVMDMPKSCFSCNMCNSNDECILQDEDANFKAYDSWEELRKGCPLKPMPKKKPTIGKESENDILCMNAGYNACIDEILGDKE